MNRVHVNKEVNVTALYFKKGNRQLTSYPKRMEFNGREYTFVESGLRYLIQKGQQLVQVFDMTDGATNYRLRFDQNQQLWTLVDVTQQPRVMA
jgi:hypothetical protein